MSTRPHLLTSVALALAVASSWAEPGAGPSDAAKHAASAAVHEVDVPYDPAGRRDPFRPPLTATGITQNTPRTPLQRYEIGQLKLVAIIRGREARAVVEDDAGLGYIIKVGTLIGSSGGQVDKIEQGRVVIREAVEDYYGEQQATEVVMAMAPDERGKQ